MPEIDFAALSAPVSDAQPCGPDLDAAGDPDYMNYVASAEGLLPQFFFAFDRKSIDFDAQLEKMRELLGATRDLRLLALLAKLSILNRDLEGLSRSVEAMATLLNLRWAELHPQPERGDFGVRAAALQSLDDLSAVVLPLQYLPLLETRRSGTISYRSHMIASGEVAPRAGEEKLDTATLDREYSEADLARLVEQRDQLLRLRAGLTRIRDIWIEHAGFDQAISFDQVLPYVSKMLALLESVIATRDPSAAAAAEPAPAATQAEAGLPAVEIAAQAAPGRVRSVPDAAAALASVAAYFDRVEPSSPALLLVRQAEQLIGKSFLDVMRILVPAAVDKANVHMGGEQTFSLPLERLGSLATNESADAARSVSLMGEDAKQAGAEIEVVESRSAAVALLDEVGAFYRAREPSSPIPLLTDRARSLTARDFLYLLDQLLLPPGQAGSR